MDFLDIHYHASPDLYQRRYSAFAAAKIYQQCNGAVILKSHLGSTVQAATLCQQEGLPVYPSVVLNKIAGGLNYKTILQALSESRQLNDFRLLVHLPTITETKHKSSLKRAFSNAFCEQYALEVEPIVIDGKLRPELIDILKMSNDFPIVISTGHANKAEIMLLLEACVKLNVKRLMLNQPASPITGLKFEDLQILALEHEFLWIEQTALTYLLNYQSWDDFTAVLQHLPRVMYSSDLGQISQPDVYEWISTTKNWFEQIGLSKTRIKEISINNPLYFIRV